MFYRKIKIKLKNSNENDKKDKKNTFNNPNINAVKIMNTYKIQRNKKKLKSKSIILNKKNKKHSLINNLSNSSSRGDINSLLKLSNKNIKEKNKNNSNPTKKDSISKPLTNNKNTKNKSKNRTNVTINNDKYISFNDQELDNLTYEEAIKYDKRTYLQYYCSLIKRKQLLLFSFFPNNDYNLRILKISLLLVSFPLYLTINGIFFNDDTMHKLYKDKGKNNFIFRIPQILYTSVIGYIITTLLRLLALSEGNILTLKKEKNYIYFNLKSN